MEFSAKIFEKHLDIKYHVPCGRSDRKTFGQIWQS